MEVYLQVFMNFEQIDWAKLLLITKFAYNNAQKINSGYILFELNYSYYPRMFFKKNLNFCFHLKRVNKLAAEL